MLSLPQWQVRSDKRSVLFNHESESVMAINIVIAMFALLALLMVIGVVAMIVVALKLKSVDFRDLFEDDAEL